MKLLHSPIKDAIWYKPECLVGDDVWTSSQNPKWGDVTKLIQLPVQIAVWGQVWNCMTFHIDYCTIRLNQ